MREEDKKRLSLEKLRDENGGEILNIIKNCDTLQGQNYQEISKLTGKLNNLNLWSDVNCRVSGAFRDMESVDPNLLRVIYEYREGIENEERDESKEVAVSFKKDSLDPTRPIIKWERDMARAKKKLNIIKKN